jgi:dynamin 1-like protein
LSTLITQTQQELAQYGESIGSAVSSQKGPLILRLLTKFSNDYIGSIDGTSSELSAKELYVKKHLSIKEMTKLTHHSRCGGARIYHIFNQVFKQALNVIPPCSNLSDHDIRTAIRNSTGPRPSLFVPELAFGLLMRPQIKLLEVPSLRCVEMVYEELMKLCHSSDTTVVSLLFFISSYHVQCF